MTEVGATCTGMTVKCDDFSAIFEPTPEIVAAPTTTELLQTALAMTERLEAACPVTTFASFFISFAGDVPGLAPALEG